MYKVKPLSVFEVDLSLTKKKYIPPKTNARAHVQRQTLCFYIFGLSLTKTQIPTRNKRWTTCTRSNSFLKFDWGLNKIQYSTGKQTGTHIQSQSNFFEFDLNFSFQLKINPKTHVQNQTQLLSWIWFWLNFDSQLQSKCRSACTMSSSCFESGLSLVRMIKSSKSHERMYKIKLIFWVRFEFDLGRSACATSNSIFLIFGSAFN